MKRFFKVIIIFFLLINSFFTYSNDNLIKRKIAIFQFINQKEISEYDYLKDVIRDALRAKLQQKDLFLFSNFNDIDKINKSKLNDELLNNEDEIIKLALKIGADIVIVGKFIVVKDKIMIISNAIDSLKKRSVISSTISGNTGIELFSLIDKISLDMTEKMAKEFPKLEKSVLEELMKEQERRLEVQKEAEIAKREAEELKLKIEKEKETKKDKNYIEDKESKNINDIIYISGGTFKMGSIDGNNDEEPLHNVTLNSFYISKYEITNIEFVKVINWGLKNNKTKFGLFFDIEGKKYDLLDYNDSDSGIDYDNDNKIFVVKTEKDMFPVNRVSWYGAVVFCNFLSEMEGLEPCYDLSNWKCDFSKNGYRLPTEAEWEFAAIGGIKSKNNIYSGSSNIDEVGWYRGNSKLDGPFKVGLKNPNELGLYDMTGNLYEWCWDIYEKKYYEESSEKNPTGPEMDRIRNYERIQRGGSYISRDKNCRVKYRYSNPQDDMQSKIGFRIVKNKK